jgi:hypothetical protein
VARQPAKSSAEPAVVTVAEQAIANVRRRLRDVDERVAANRARLARLKSRLAAPPK